MLFFFFDGLVLFVFFSFCFYGTGNSNVSQSSLKPLEFWAGSTRCCVVLLFDNLFTRRGWWDFLSPMYGLTRSCLSGCCLWLVWPHSCAVTWRVVTLLFLNIYLDRQRPGNYLKGWKINLNTVNLRRHVGYLHYLGEMHLLERGNEDGMLG